MAQRALFFNAQLELFYQVYNILLFFLNQMDINIVSEIKFVVVQPSLALTIGV